MDEEKLIGILRKAHALEVEQAPTRHRYGTDNCPSLPRLWELGYRPSTQTAEEREHIPDCLYCQMTLHMARLDAYHPQFIDLRYYILGGSLREEERENISQHLEELRCESCLHLAQLLKMWEAHKA